MAKAKTRVKSAKHSTKLKSLPIKHFHEHLAQIKTAHPKNKIKLFQDLPLEDQGFILWHLTKHSKQTIIHSLTNKELLKILHYLDPDEATDLIQELSKKRQTQITKNLSSEIKEKVEFMLRFDPHSAAGMMSLDYIEIKSKLTFKQTSELVKRHEKRTGKVPTILVLKGSKIVGELRVHDLAIQKNSSKITPFIKPIRTIHYDAKTTEVITLFQHIPHKKVVVLHEDNSILGVIYSDDVLKNLQKQSAKSLYRFAGVEQEEDVNDPISSKVKNRYRWLIVNLATAFLAALVVSLFQDTISSFVLLAAYMPIIAGMGGNAGTQTLAIMVRAITLKEVKLQTGAKVIFKETSTGILNGIIIGLIITAIAFIFKQNMLIGAIAAIAMVINLAIAGFFGSVIPLIMKRLGKDPATSATIFITTATDIFGFFIFLGLASLVL